MKRPKLLIPAALSAVLMLGLAQRPARAGYVHEWAFREIAERSEVLATAQVESVQTLGSVEGTLPAYPQLRRRALLRVLRAVAKPQQEAPRAGQVLAVEFNTFDRTRTRVFVDSSPDELPSVSPGQIFVFPLRRAVPAEVPAQPQADGGEWRLLDGYGINLLTPALAEEPPRPSPSTSLGFDLLRSELAGVFVHGDGRQVLSAMERYHFAYWMGGSPLLNSFDLIEQSVSDEERWLSIAAAGLMVSAHTTPRVPLRDLLSQPPSRKNWRQFLQMEARVLAHVPRLGLEKRLVQLVLKLSRGRTGNWDSRAAALMVNEFGEQPEARRELQAGLEREDKAWIFAAGWMTGEDNPLADVALAWALKRLALGGPVRQFWDFVPLILRWGSAQDVEALARRIERARLSDRPAYKALLSAGVGGDPFGLGQKQRPLPVRVWSPVLDDRSEYQKGWRGWRWCDQAALEIGHEARLGLSIREGATLQQRDQAVARALAWRDHNLKPSKPRPAAK